jgi:hypothetical protein
VSYFATVSGVNLGGAHVDGLTFVPADQAQDYIRDLVPKIAALDGEPVFFCDDKKTGTSSDFVGAAEDFAFERGTLDGHAMLQLLALCERTRAVLRIWWAQDGPDDFQRVVACKTASEAVQFMLAATNPMGWHVRLAPRKEPLA